MTHIRSLSENSCRTRRNPSSASSQDAASQPIITDRRAKICDLDILHP